MKVWPGPKQDAQEHDMFTSLNRVLLIIETLEKITVKLLKSLF